MATLTRCKFCGSYPTFFNMAGGWNIYCDCMFGAGAAQDFFADWSAGVENWNKHYGVETESTYVSPALESMQPNCTCESRELLWYGCRCVYSQWKAKYKNKC